jgi:hypothetical protein
MVLVVASLIKRAVESLYKVLTLKAISLTALFSLIFLTCAIISCAQPISSALILLYRRFSLRRSTGERAVID